jgi:bifunctional ADP-heptose synthase (sugar kinase/adenylyltransferase)
VGEDIYAREMKSLFENIGANFENIIELNTWDTCTYTKPIERNHEQNRIDFGTNNSLDESFFEELLANLEKQLRTIGLIIINQQFPKPLLTEIRIQKLNVLINKYPNCMTLADLRTNGLAIRNAILKVNVSELAHLLLIGDLEEENERACEKNIVKLSEKIDCQILLTRGKEGIMFYNKQNIYQLNALKIDNEIDTVGAGDTVVSAFATAYKSTGNIVESLEFANLAAAVSIQKLKQTGTASAAEIIDLVNKK